jgi:hypothetical protein
MMFYLTKGWKENYDDKRRCDDRSEIERKKEEKNALRTRTLRLGAAFPSVHMGPNRME